MAPRKSKMEPLVWWDTQEDPHRLLFQHVRALENDQRDIAYQNRLNAKLYSNRDLMAFDWDSDILPSHAPLNSNLENVIQSVCDTLLALVGKNRPKATPVARGADFDVFLKARQLDRYLWGTFLSQDIYRKAERVFLDSCIYGTGFLKIDIDTDENEIFTERVHPDEIVVDQRECISCDEPMQMHHRKLCSRLWLLQEYGHGNPELRELIKRAQTKNFAYTSYRSPPEEQIIVIESWKLPTCDDAGDGRHVVCIENATLLDEDYDRNCFPIIPLRWNNPQSGFYGRSLVEDLTGYQIRLNELNEVIRVGQDQMCVPRVLVNQGSGVVKTQIDNTLGKIITYRGEAPQAVTWGAFNPEIYNERDRIRSSAFEFAGVSQLSSQAKLPTQARLDSSEALREFNAIENERFSHQAQAYEQLFIDAAKQYVTLSAELYKNGTRRKEFYRSRYLIDQIDWKQINLAADQYVLEISTSSILNMTPAARKDKLNEWAAAGIITQEEYKAWSGSPDLERLSDLMSASKDYVEYVVDKLLSGDQEITPDPLSDLQLTFRVVHDTYLHLRALETPEEILQGFREFLVLCQHEAAPAQPQPSAPAQLGPGSAAGSIGPDNGMGMSPPQEGMLPGNQLPVNGLGTSPQTGAPVPSVSPIAAQSFVS